MPRVHRSSIVFAALIALCALSAWLGAHDRLEGVLQDLAVRAGAYATHDDDPPRVLVVAIDDNTIDYVAGEPAFRDTWEWSRAIHALLVDELRVLGARTIVFDITFGDESDDLRGTRALLKAIERHGNVVLAARMASEAPDVTLEGTPLGHAVSEVRRAGEQAFEHPSLIAAIDAGETLTQAEEGVIRRVAGYQGEAGVEIAEADRLRAALLIGQARMYLRAAADAPRAEPGSRFPRFDPGSTLPVTAVGLHAAALGNTDMGSEAGESGGVVRRIPLWISDTEHAFAVLGLEAAMRHAGLRVRSLTDTRIRFEGAGAPGDVPMAVDRLPGFPEREIGGIARVRWPRGTDLRLSPVERWRRQFDADRERRVLSAMEVINAVILRARLEPRLAAIDERVDYFATFLEAPFDTRAYLERGGALRPARTADASWAAAMEAHRRDWEALRGRAEAMASELGARPEDERSPTDEAMLELARAALELGEEQGAAVREIDDLRSRQRELGAVSDGLVFIGSVATKRAVDMRPTSIGETPGVFVHAALARSVLTGSVPAPAPAPLAPALAAVFGLLGLSVGRRLPQWFGVLVVAGMCAMWFVVAAWIVDARLGLGSVIAAPMLSVAAVWLARSTYRSLIELRARRRTEERFKSYVAPDVVDILVNNPELSSMEPQRRELTIMFTDIAGFTTMAERLGTQRTTDVLSEYLREMTGVLASTRATLDKYLGDGIMAFWGAPIENQDHALDACDAAMQMIERLDALNERGVFGEVGPAIIRVGIATGTVSVGDFGNPPHRSAYTVIGDSVNLAARLESANKQLGTTILMNQRCAELVGDRVRSRAVGSIVVVGKSTPEPIREVVGEREIKRERTAEWIAACDEALDHFSNRRWDMADAAYARLRDEFGDARIAHLHHDAILRLREDERLAPSIELTEK